jgi:hypothetical protein
LLLCSAQRRNPDHPTSRLPNADDEMTGRVQIGREDTRVAVEEFSIRQYHRRWPRDPTFNAKGSAANRPQSKQQRDPAFTSEDG